MNGVRGWHVIGTDLSGRRCPIARVFVPSEIEDKERALRYIRRLPRSGPYGQFFPYATATEVEPE